MILSNLLNIVNVYFIGKNLTIFVINFNVETTLQKLKSWNYLILFLNSLRHSVHIFEKILPDFIALFYPKLTDKLVNNLLEYF